ncbi:hypothetical protein TNCV_1190431 [Trichonephila clavipes]|nr:hypothetical protein TNCV_1190431 [Trichonephila clavipes]
MFRKTNSNIPPLTHASGIATSDDQKANTLANSFKTNYTENKRPDNFTNNIDSDVTSTLENFFANPPTTPFAPTNTDEADDDDLTDDFNNRYLGCASSLQPSIWDSDFLGFGNLGLKNGA